MELNDKIRDEMNRAATAVTAQMREAGELPEGYTVAYDTASYPGDAAGKDLVTRIRAVLDEDERVANAATDHLLDGGPRGFETEDLPDPIRRHIFGWTPARVLVQVEAMRKILAIHSDRDGDGCVGCGHVNECPTVLALAEALEIEAHRE